MSHTRTAASRCSTVEIVTSSRPRLVASSTDVTSLASAGISTPPLSTRRKTMPEPSGAGCSSRWIDLPVWMPTPETATGREMVFWEKSGWRGSWRWLE